MKIHKHLAIAALLATAAAGLAAQALHPQIAAPTASVVEGRQGVVPFELYRGNRIVLSGRINGVDTPMILDSGAGMTTLDRAFAQKIGLTGGRKITARGMGGQQDAELFENVTIEAGNLRLSGATVVAIDLTQIAKGIGRPMPVILGRELFMNSIVTLDFDRSELSLSPARNFVAPSGAREVKLRREGTLHLIPVSIGGLAPVDAAFDLGNGGALSISRDYRERQPMFAQLPYAIGMSGGVGGLHESRRTTISKVEMAGFTFDAVPAELSDFAKGPYRAPANVGIQMFRPFKLTLDLGNDRMWLQRTARPVEFIKDRSGLFTLLEGDHLNVLHVSPGSPADRAGLKKGDKLTAINGVAVGPDFFVGQMSSWSRGVTGTTVKIAKADGSAVTLTLADYY